MLKLKEVIGIKKQRILALFLFLLGVALLTVGCKAKPTATNNQVQRPFVEAKVYAGSKQEIVTKEFDYGEAVYVDSAGAKTPYRLQGVLSLPKEEKSRGVAVIIHGSHDNSNVDRRFDLGFTYLTKALAERGYGTVALNVQPAFVWEYGDNQEAAKISAMLPKFFTALADNNPNLPMDNVILLGHSQGGGAVLQGAAVLPQVKGIISLAPASFVGINNFLPDVPSAIIVPEFDGDVASLDGYEFFRAFANAPQRQSSTALVLLKQANHNGFNSALPAVDGLANLDPEIFKTLTGAEQQLFLAEFMADFLDFVFTGTTTNPLFEQNSPEPQKMYGFPVGCLFKGRGEEKLDFTQAEPKHAQVRVVQEHSFWAKDEAPEFNLPFIPRDALPISMLAVDWQKKNAGFIINLGNLDLSNKTNFTITLGANPAGKNGDLSQSLEPSLIVCDEAGIREEVSLSSQALYYPLGEVTEVEVAEKTFKTWSRPTPTGLIRVPLNLLSKIDLTRVTSIELIFPNSTKGSIMVESLAIN